MPDDEVLVVTSYDENMNETIVPASEFNVPPAEPVAPQKPKHPLNVMAELFRTEAYGASGPVAGSLLRLADAFDNYAKGL